MNDWTRRHAREWAGVETGPYEAANGVPPAENGTTNHKATTNGDARGADSPTETLFRRARELERVGDLSAAHDLYQRVLLDDPGNIRARNNLGCLYDAQGRHALALDQFEVAHALGPENIDV